MDHPADCLHCRFFAMAEAYMAEQGRADPEGGVKVIVGLELALANVLAHLPDGLRDSALRRIQRDLPADVRQYRASLLRGTAAPVFPAGRA